MTTSIKAKMKDKRTLSIVECQNSIGRKKCVSLNKIKVTKLVAKLLKYRIPLRTYFIIEMLCVYIVLCYPRNPYSKKSDE